MREENTDIKHIKTRDLKAMKKQITDQQKLMKILVFLFIVFLVLSCSSAFGYGLDSHYQIAAKAVENSSLNDALQQIGFTSYIKNGVTSCIVNKC
jgi:uncharacterized membrane protein